MITTRTNALRQSLAALAAATLFAACAEQTPVDPSGRSAAASLASLTAAEVEAASYGRLPDLGICQRDVGVPEGSKISFHVYATGVQIYQWNGTSWQFVSPKADLFADAGLSGFVGDHFAGPTWRTVSGSTVVGTTVTGRCTPDPAAIAWLRLDAGVSGSGVFEQTQLIQRLNTVGGLAPATPGAKVGDEAKVPYTAEYFFYRAP